VRKYAFVVSLVLAALVTRPNVINPRDPVCYVEYMGFTKSLSFLYGVVERKQEKNNCVRTGIYDERI